MAAAKPKVMAPQATMSIIVCLLVGNRASQGVNKSFCLFWNGKIRISRYRRYRFYYDIRDKYYVVENHTASYLNVADEEKASRSRPFLIDVVGEKPKNFTKPIPQSDGTTIGYFDD